MPVAAHLFFLGRVECEGLKATTATWDRRAVHDIESFTDGEGDGVAVLGLIRRDDTMDGAVLGIVHVGNSPVVHSSQMAGSGKKGHVE